MSPLQHVKESCSNFEKSKHRYGTCLGIDWKKDGKPYRRADLPANKPCLVAQGKSCPFATEVLLPSVKDKAGSEKGSAVWRQLLKEYKKLEA